jgi:hypothetical protein
MQHKHIDPPINTQDIYGIVARLDQDGSQAHCEAVEELKNRSYIYHAADNLMFAMREIAYDYMKSLTTTDIGDRTF